MGVGFCWLRDVPWDGCWCSLCDCLVGSWTVGFVVGLDSGSVCGYEILTWLWVVVFWSVGIWWVMIWFECGLEDGWLLL